MANSPIKKFVINPLETLAEEGVNEMKGLTKDFAKSAMESITGKRVPLKGEFTTGIQKTNQEIAKKDNSLEKKVQYLQRVNAEQGTAFRSEKDKTQKAIEGLLQELRVEVKRLESQTAELTGSVKNITVESSPVRAGIYHKNFFEWVLLSLRDLRKKVSESRMWLNTWQKKKQKGFWANAKKGKDLNLEYMFNEERAVSVANG